jgi:hypothetical protein
MTWLPAAFWKILAGPFSRLPALVVLLWPLCAWSGPGIELMWDPSPDASVAGYKIYYGTASRSYTSQVDAGKVTSISITLPAYDTTYYLTATTYDAYGVESDFSNEATCLVAGTVVSNPPPVVYTAPTIAAIGNVSIAENAGSQTVNLSGISPGSGTSLTITASSSNPALIPHPTISHAGTNATGSLSFTPIAYANGSAQITVTVSNGQPTNNLATRTFTVNVASVNQAPTLNALGNLVINYSPATQTVNLSGITSGATNENQTLTVTASSSNPALIPNPTVSYVSPNTTGSLAFTPAFNTNGSATITVSVNDGGASNNILSQNFTVTVSPVYQAPTLAAIGNVSIAENAGTQTVNLSGITTGSGSALTITASSSNPALIPHPTVNYTSPDATGSLSFTPVASANGSAVVTVTVNNGQPANNLATRSFTVTVSTGNQAPTLNPLGDLILSYNSSARLINLSGIGSGAASEKQTLTVTASSSNPTLIPKPAVSYSNPNTVGSLTLKPATNTSGSAVITVTVNDGAAANNTCTRTFKVTVPGLSQSPWLSAISDVAIEENAGTQIVSLSDISPGSGQSLTITASSSNPALVPHPAVNHASPDTTGSLTFTPAANTSGSTVITVTVNNGEPTNNLVSQSFTVNVAAVNQAPTLNALSDLTLDYGSPVQTISLSGIGSGAADEFQPLTVKAVSSNTKLIPHPSVSYSSPLATGTLTLKPAANASGPAIITVIVNDGGASNNVVTQTFTVNINPKTDSPTTLKLTKQPKSQVVITGKTAKLEVSASGTGKLKYQWKCNGTNIAKATGPKLNLKKCSARHAGIYSVTVSDAGGSVSSTQAALVVSPTPAATLTAAVRSDGNFSFNVVGVDGYSYAVQTSEDFIHWTSVQTNTAPFAFVDTNAAQAERRFYRTVCLTP